MGWLDSLQKRWGVGHVRQVVLILFVFALTGTTVVLLKKPVLNWLFDGGERPLWATVLYYVLILPIYNVFLLLYGFLLGQFAFFWSFEKRFLDRIFGRTKKNQP